MPRILLADDDRAFGSVLKSELNRDGFNVTLVADGVEAVMEALADHIDGGATYDFVLLDIKMPRLDGINALRIIKLLNSRMPAITFSGNAGSGEMAESVRAGAIRCLTKPFGIPQLKDDIKNHLSRNARV